MGKNPMDILADILEQKKKDKDYLEKEKARLRNKYTIIADHEGGGCVHTILDDVFGTADHPFAHGIGSIVTILHAAEAMREQAVEASNITVADMERPVAIADIAYKVLTGKMVNDGNPMNVTEIDATPLTPPESVIALMVLIEVAGVRVLKGMLEYIKEIAATEKEQEMASGNTKGADGGGIGGDGQPPLKGGYIINKEVKC